MWGQGPAEEHVGLSLLRLSLPLLSCPSAIRQELSGISTS